MYYANCEWYVDMGEHNKPLCERKSLRPAKCSECPVYIRSIESENAKLKGENELLLWANRRYEGEVVSLKADIASLHGLVRDMLTCIRHMENSDYYWDGCKECSLFGKDECDFEGRMRELGMEVEDG